MEQITTSVKRKFQGRPEKFYEVTDWSFEVSIQSFILNFEVCDQSFEVREARLNRFDCKVRESCFVIHKFDVTGSRW